MPIPPLSLIYTTTKNGPPRSEPLRNGLRIGSSAEWNDLVLPFTGVNAVHAEIRELAEGGFEILAMGSSLVVVDTVTVKRERLKPGGEVVIGSVRGRIGVPISTRTGTVAIPSPTRPLTPSWGVLRIVAIAAASAALSGGAVFFALSRGKAVKAEKPPTAATDAALLHLPTPGPTPTGDPLEAAKKAVVTVIAKLSFEPGFSTGTGFFVTSSGKLVTNLHVVKKTDYQQILFPGKTTPIDARILAKDEDNDLALLQCYVTPPVPVAPMAIAAVLKMGDTVYALGSPAGPKLELSLTKGIVSADELRRFGEVALLQHDAAINPGNSGGPLINQQGYVVGINTLKIRDTSGLNFAVPIERVRAFLNLN